MLKNVFQCCLNVKVLVFQILDIGFCKLVIIYSMSDYVLTLRVVL